MSKMGEKIATVSVICPLFNAQTEIIPFDRSLKKQKGVKIIEKQYILTKSRDHTEVVLQAANIPYQLIPKTEFSHSKTREKAAMESTGDIIVFLTQDVVIKDDDFIAKLIAPIVKGEADATYARQLTKYNNIEKYTREHNYPTKSFTVSKKDIKKRGLKTFFFSDAAGAIKASKFRELKGYDGKNLPISEDMYFAYKLIMCGGKIRYVAEARVYHSHKFTLKQLYNRYKLTGAFMQMNPEIAKHGINSAGGGMA
ncbi:glycosyltransferase, partial [Candidatus Saccharibacteria bacterium]|nr:glycosyltransferase [Candidatus Saccharibacteria bacterium]